MVLATDRKKPLFAALLALAAVVVFSLALSKWEGKSDTEENKFLDNLVTRVNDAANQADEEFKRGP